jgi:hypothetical protein
MGVPALSSIEPSPGISADAATALTQIEQELTQVNADLAEIISTLRAISDNTSTIAQDQLNFTAQEARRIAAAGLIEAGLGPPLLDVDCGLNKVAGRAQRLFNDVHRTLFAVCRGANQPALGQVFE